MQNVVAEAYVCIMLHYFVTGYYLYVVFVQSILMLCMRFKTRPFPYNWHAIFPTFHNSVISYYIGSNKKNSNISRHRESILPHYACQCNVYIGILAANRLKMKLYYLILLHWFYIILSRLNYMNKSYNWNLEQYSFFEKPIWNVHLSKKNNWKF